MLGDFVSLLAGVAVITMSLLVMKAYPKHKRSEDMASNQLQTAIFWSFFAAMMNSIYWQFGGQLLVEFTGFVSVEMYREVGNWVDLAVKGLITWAGWLHLRALYYALPEKERRGWHIIDMPFYPNKLKLFSKLGCGKPKGDDNG